MKKYLFLLAACLVAATCAAQQLRIRTADGLLEYNYAAIENIVLVANNEDVVRRSAFDSDDYVPDNRGGEYTMTVKDSEGGEVVFELLNNLNIRITDEVLYVNLASQSFDYGIYIDYLAEILIEKKTSSGIDDPTPAVANPTVRFEGPSFVISNLAPGAPITVYNVSGILLLNAEADADGTADLDLERYAGQVVLIKGQNISLKLKI